MKIVKLSKKDLAEWRENTSHLVDAEGYVKARVDRPLESAIATVARSARSQRKTLSQKVAIGAREHTIVVTVTRTGLDSSDLALDTSVDGCRLVTGRQVVAARMLQEHGECQLRAPNNVILKVVRDPSKHRPTFKESEQIAPKPEHCPCRAWGAPHPDRHYPTCQWNRLAPPDERALTDEVPEAEARLLPTEALPGLRARGPLAAATAPIAARVDPRAVVAQPPALDAPETCRNGCLDWATPKGFPIPKGQHHPTCEFAKAWAIKTTREVPRWLVDLHTGLRVRLATDSEVGQGEVAAQRTGSPIIHVDDTPYAVILESELDAATGELPSLSGEPRAVFSPASEAAAP